MTLLEEYIMGLMDWLYFLKLKILNLIDTHIKSSYFSKVVYFLLLIILVYIFMLLFLHSFMFIILISHG
jgi:hypothetical protein